MITTRPSSTLQRHADVLAQRSAAGAPASQAELADVARTLDVAVEELRAAVEQALSSGVASVEDAGARTAAYRKHAAGVTPTQTRPRSISRGPARSAVTA